MSGLVGCVAILQWTTRRETSCLGGIDLIAFTGGIGEHDTKLLSDVCHALGDLGVRVNTVANDAADGSATASIHSPDSKRDVWVVPTDEGRVAAREASMPTTAGLNP